MLTNKKFMRIFALVLALLMTVAVFSGCNKKAIDEAKKEAEEAKQAAQQAQENANAVAKAAKDLADKLKESQDKASQLQQDLDKAKEAITSAVEQQKNWHGEVPAESQPIQHGEYDEATKKLIETDKVRALANLKYDYLESHPEWYTDDARRELANIFAEANTELLRQTSIEGADQIIANAQTKAGVVPNIITDAQQVQSKIAAFGDVEKELFTSGKGKVDAARKEFDGWVRKYEDCFFNRYGLSSPVAIAGNERAIVDLARQHTNNQVYINTNNDTNSLLYAEAKLNVLFVKAEETIREMMIQQLVTSGRDPAYTEESAKKVVDKLYENGAMQTDINAKLDAYKKAKKFIENNNGVEVYDKCKANAAGIEKAYKSYREFWAANGYDDSPVAASPKNAPGEHLLNAEEFINAYVLEFYNGELTHYQNKLYDYLNNMLVPYFVNKSNTSLLKDAVGSYLTIYGDANEGYNKDGDLVVTSLTDKLEVAVEEGKFDIYDADGYVVKTIANGDGVDSLKVTREFSKIVSLAAGEIYAKEYSKDYKGHKSLADAFADLDKILIETIVKLSKAHFENVMKPVIQVYLNEDIVGVKGEFAGDPEQFKKANEAFTENAIQYLNRLAANFGTKEIADYDASKLGARKLFKPAYDANGVFEDISLEMDAKKSAIKYVLGQYGSATEKEYKAYYNGLKVNYPLAVALHDYKKEYVVILDRFIGQVGKFKDGNVDEWKGDAGTLYADYHDAMKGVIGDKKDEAIYNALDPIRKATQESLMAIEYLDFETGEILFAADEEQGKDATSKHNKLYVKADGTITKDSKNTAPLMVHVDRIIVGGNKVMTTFIDGANAMLKAFCDFARNSLTDRVDSAIDLYRANYSFGDLDPHGVYLEKDMLELEGDLKKVAGLDAIDAKAADYSLQGDYITAANVGELGGYDKQIIKDKDGNPVGFKAHVYHSAGAEEVTGIGDPTEATAKSWYDQRAKAGLDEFFGLTSEGVYANLEDCRKLAYTKDTVINGVAKVELTGEDEDTLKTIYNGYKGGFNSAGNWTGNEGYEYEKSNERTELYLVRLQEAYDRIAKAVEGVTLKKHHLDLAAAKKEIHKILAEAVSTEVTNDKKDDMRLPVVYMRYYQVNAYNWAAYEASK